MQTATVKLTTSKPLKGEGYIDLPTAIKTKKAVINVKNKDNKCFDVSNKW